jgi:putative FmdB family regulatory protein
MPTYEYKCNKCEEVFEVFQKITDEPLKECPVCGGEVKRLVSGGAGIIFKGSGFYTTDYKGSVKSAESLSDRNKGKEDKKSSAKEETKKETVTSESKPSESQKENKKS